jgi:hypothetical protein
MLDRSKLNDFLLFILERVFQLFRETRGDSFRRFVKEPTRNAGSKTQKQTLTHQEEKVHEKLKRREGKREFEE